MHPQGEDTRTQRKNIAGLGSAILSAVLFGTVPLTAKTAFAPGSNAYTTVFGRFGAGGPDA